MCHFEHAILAPNSLGSQLGYAFGPNNPYNPLAIANNVARDVFGIIGVGVQAYNHGVEKLVSATGGSPADAEILKFWGPMALSAGLSNLRLLGAESNGLGKFAVSDLVRTDKMSGPEFTRLLASIAKDGLQNPLIRYTVIGDTPYVLQGSNRLLAARMTDMENRLIFQEVQLPYLGYKNTSSVIESAVEVSGRGR